MELQYPDGNEALYDYSHGAVADVRLKVGSATSYAASGVSYLPMDLGMTGWTSYNGLTNTLGFDTDGRLTGISVQGVESLAFSYDADNRVTHIDNGMDGSQSQSLGYDALGRLTSVASVAQNASYGYDADGNRIAQTLNGVEANFAYSASSNQLVSASGGINATYGYNADGNTTTVNGLAAYSYGPFNRLVNAGGASFVISAEGQRLEKSGGGNTTYLAPGGGGTTLAEDLNGIWRDYVWLNGRLVTVLANGGVFSVATDQTGRPVAMTAPNSHAVVWAAAGLPFDRQVTQNNWGDFNIGFPGQYFDSEDGLYQNGARDYDAALGRFIESDPIGLAGGMNTYAYVGNNPLNYIDPLGLCCSSWQKWAAKQAKTLEKTSNKYGNYAIISGGATFVAVGAEVPTFGGDTPATGALLGADVAIGGTSVVTGYLSATLDTYASGGDPRYYLKFGAEYAANRLTNSVLGKVSFFKEAGEALSDMSEKFAGSLLPLGEPCDSQ